MFLLFRIRELITRFNAMVYRGVKNPLRRIREQFGVLAKLFRQAGKRRRRRGEAKKKSRSENRQRKQRGLKPKKPRRVPVRDRTATFDVAARGVLLMAFGGVLLSALLFFAGFLTGLRWKAAPAGLASGQVATAPVATTQAAGGQGATDQGATGPAAPEAIAAERGAARAAAVDPSPALAQPAATAVPGGSAAAAVAGQAAGAASPAVQGAGGAAVAAGQVAQQLAPPPAFTLRVGSFLIEEDAQAFVKLLTGRGYQPAVEKLRGVGEKQVFRVVVGGFATYAEAEQAASDFSGKEQIEAIALPLRATDGGVL